MSPGSDDSDLSLRRRGRRGGGAARLPPAPPRRGTVAPVRRGAARRGEAGHVRGRVGAVARRARARSPAAGRRGAPACSPRAAARARGVRQGAGRRPHRPRSGADPDRDPGPAAARSARPVTTTTWRSWPRGRTGRNGPSPAASCATWSVRVRAGLVRLGVRRGDRVVALAPNTVETLVAFLAAASLGAIWSVCSPDFGARAVRDRFAQIEPAVLVAVDGYRYGGKRFDVRPTVAALQAQLPTLRAVVLVPSLDPAAELEGTLPWAERAVAAGGASPRHLVRDVRAVRAVVPAGRAAAARRRRPLGAAGRRLHRLAAVRGGLPMDRRRGR